MRKSRMVRNHFVLKIIRSFMSYMYRVVINILHFSENDMNIIFLYCFGDIRKVEIISDLSDEVLLEEDEEEEEEEEDTEYLEEDKPVVLPLEVTLFCLLF